MHSTRRLFVCSFFLYFSGIFISSDDFVSAWSDSPFKSGKNIIENMFDWINFKNSFENFVKFVKPTENDSNRVKSSVDKDESNWFVQSIKTAIEVTSEYCKSKKPLTFFTALEETCLVNQTGKSLQVTILNPITVATMTGGILGNDLYEFYKYSFAWQDSACNTTYNLEARVIYRNLKYDSFEKALDYSDGVVMVTFPIATNGDFPNPQFYEFSHLLQTKIKYAGDYATIGSSFTYTWFVNFPFDSIYHSYTMPYWDENTDKTATAMVIELPLDQRVNYISDEQFHATFDNMGDISGQISQEQNYLSSKETHKGIVVLYLPA